MKQSPRRTILANLSATPAALDTDELVRVSADDAGIILSPAKTLIARIIGDSRVRQTLALLVLIIVGIVLNELGLDPTLIPAP